MLLQKLREHRGRCLVQGSATSDADRSRFVPQRAELTLRYRGKGRRCIPNVIRRLVLVVGQIVDEAVDGFFDLYAAIMIEHTAIDIELSQRQPLDGNVVVIGR